VEGEQFSKLKRKNKKEEKNHCSLLPSEELISISAELCGGVQTDNI